MPLSLPFTLSPLSSLGPGTDSPAVLAVTSANCSLSIDLSVYRIIIESAFAETDCNEDRNGHTYDRREDVCSPLPSSALLPLIANIMTALLAMQFTQDHLFLLDNYMFEQLSLSFCILSYSWKVFPASREKNETTGKTGQHDDDADDDEMRNESCLSSPYLLCIIPSSLSFHSNLCVLIIIVNSRNDFLLSPN